LTEGESESSFEPLRLTIAGGWDGGVPDGKNGWIKMFPYLQGFKLKASGPNTIEYKIGEIKNRISSGYNLREIMAEIAALDAESVAVMENIRGLL